MAEETEGYAPIELLPATDALTLDPELAAFEADEEVDGPPKPLGRGWAFDFEEGQFIRHGGAPALVSEIDNLRVWIEMTLRTARGAHPIYSDSYGVELPWASIGQPFSSEAVGSMTTAITEALMVHDRIESVSDFQFTGGLDSEVLFVDFTVTVDDEDFEMSALPVGETF